MAKGIHGHRSRARLQEDCLYGSSVSNPAKAAAEEHVSTGSALASDNSTASCTNWDANHLTAAG